MATLPADQAIQRFKDNENRIDQFVNSETSYTASDGEVVESLKSFTKKLKSLANEQQTAVDGQTVFNLTKFTYTQGVGAIHIYRNGERLFNFGETGPAQVTLLDPANAGDAFLFEAFQTVPLGTTAASQVNYNNRKGVAVAVQDALRDIETRSYNSPTVNVLDYGADSSGIADSLAAFNGAKAAIATISKVGGAGGTIVVPPGSYFLSAPFELDGTGQRLISYSPQDTYLITDAVTAYDMVRVSGALCEVSGLHFRPKAPNNVCLRIYGGRCKVSGNRFLSAASKSGTAIVLQSSSLDGTTGIPGAYNHEIVGNHIGAGGYEFALGIDQFGLMGQQANYIARNQILADTGIKNQNGGGNTYTGNLLQSATGTVNNGYGNGFDFGQTVTGEMVFGNYIERYQYGVLLRSTDGTYNLAHVAHNHWDNNTNRVYPIGGAAVRYVFFDDDIIHINKWSIQAVPGYGFTINDQNGNALLTLDETAQTVKVSKVVHKNTTLSFNADSTTLAPASTVITISGNGAHRVGCILGTTGVQDGQECVLIGITWSVELTNATIKFNSTDTAVTIGNQAGQCQGMRLIYNAALGKWIEVGTRTLS